MRGLMGALTAVSIGSRHYTALRRSSLLFMTGMRGMRTYNFSLCAAFGKVKSSVIFD